MLETVAIDQKLLCAFKVENDRHARLLLLILDLLHVALVRGNVDIALANRTFATTAFVLFTLHRV